jgi:hypothetical protein
MRDIAVNVMIGVEITGASFRIMRSMYNRCVAIVIHCRSPQLPDEALRQQLLTVLRSVSRIMETDDPAWKV